VFRGFFRFCVFGVVSGPFLLGFFRVWLCVALLDPVHYMILLGSKYAPNMISEVVVLLRRGTRFLCLFFFLRGSRVVLSGFVEFGYGVEDFLGALFWG
jgi:hypothetical protein